MLYTEYGLQKREEGENASSRTRSDYSKPEMLSSTRQILPWTSTPNVPCDHSWKRTLVGRHGTAYAATTLTRLGHAGAHGPAYLYLTSIKRIKRGSYLHDTRQPCNRNVELATMSNRSLRRHQSALRYVIHRVRVTEAGVGRERIFMDQKRPFEA